MRKRRSENRQKERKKMPRIGDTHAIQADIGAAIGPGHRELPRLIPGRIVYINRARTAGSSSRLTSATASRSARASNFEGVL